jgi:FHA domain-containing protein
MILTLRAVSLNDQPLTRPITARFDAAGGTIGRADHSTLALPDPERFISRKQAEIVFVNGGFLIRNIGAANPIILANRSLGNGESAMLGDGDDVRIGGYLLRAECSTAAQLPPEPATFSNLLRTGSPAAPRVPQAPAPAPVLAAPAPVARAPAPSPVTAPRPAPSASNPFADLLGGGDDLSGTPAPAAPVYNPRMVSGHGAADPFADLLGAPAPAPLVPAPAGRKPGAFDDLMPPAAGLSARSASVAPPPPAPAQLPDDFDPFGAPPAPTPRLASSSADPFADLAPVAPPPSIDQQFGLPAAPGGGAAPTHDPLKDFEFGLGTLGGPASGSALPATDPLAMFEAAPLTAPAVRAAPPPPPMQDNLPGVNAAFEPPRVAPPAPAPSPLPRSMAAPAVSPSSPALNAALWQAFCEGAGVQIPLPSDPAQAAIRMHQVGLVLRAAVEGTRELMAVRASTKYEMRASVTQIQARSNNPLKFAPDTRTGVEQLVQPAARGFLEGPAAMDDAMRDLVGHSIGSVAGMRAALEGLLDRFDPATLEKILGAGSVLDNLVPLNRKARLWELYLQRFRALREEAQEDFHSLFGKAFVAAYEQQVARLKQGQSGGGKKGS